MHEEINYMGQILDCDDCHTTDSSGTWCNCPFLFCTGSQDCSNMGGLMCGVVNNDYDYMNIQDEDCDCQYLG